MQELRAGSSRRHRFAINLKALQVFQTLLHFGFLPHAGPDVGINKIRSIDRSQRIVCLRDQDLPCIAIHLVQEFRVKLISRGSTNRKLNPQLATH